MPRPRSTMTARTAAKACNTTVIKSIMERFDTDANSVSSVSSRASAYLQGCNMMTAPDAWDRSDADDYFKLNWQPRADACDFRQRFGPERTTSDGGYTLCMRGANGAAGLLQQGRSNSASKCRVVSIGLNDDTRFESALKRERPDCDIHGYDGSLHGARAHLRDKLPAFIQFYPEYFTENTYKRYTNTSITLLKVDCEDCEWRGTLLPNAWLQHVCTDQIVLELHRGRRGRGPCNVWTMPFNRQVMRMHQLFTAFDEQYYIIHREPNIRHYGCDTVSLIRRQPCP